MELGVAATLLLVTFFSCLVIINVWRQMSQRHRLPPGPTPLPIVGNLLQVKSGKIVTSLLKLRDIYGPVFTVYLGPRRVVVLCGYEVLKEALIDQADDFKARGSLPSFETIFRGSGIGVTNGETWKQLRRFTLMTLRNFGMGKRSIEEQIIKEANFLVEELRRTKGSAIHPESLLIHPSANVIFSITVGDRFDYEDETFNKILENMREGFHIMSSFWGQLYDMFPRVMNHLPGPHNKMFELFRYLEDFLLERVEMNRKTLDLNYPRDYIDCYLIQRERGKQNPLSEFTIIHLVMTVMDIIFGGTETITTTLTHGLLALMKYPEILDKVQMELDSVVGENRSPTFEDRLKMPYTNAVLHEIQRYSDTLPMGATHSVTCDTPFREFVLTKGTDIFPMLTTSMKDERYFPGPRNFNPRHFLDESGHFKKSEAFMPFSIGKRDCPGQSLARMELFIFLTTILQNFNLNSPIDLKDIDLTPIESGFENLPPPYKISFLPRQVHVS